MQRTESDLFHAIQNEEANYSIKKVSIMNILAPFLGKHLSVHLSNGGQVYRIYFHPQAET